MVSKSSSRGESNPGCAGFTCFRVYVCVFAFRLAQRAARLNPGMCLSADFGLGRPPAAAQKEFSQWDFFFNPIFVSARCNWQPLAWFTWASAVMTAIGCGHTWRCSTGGPVSSGSAHRCVTGSLRPPRLAAFLTSPAQSCARSSLWLMSRLMKTN